jgi:hypothetical protein
MPHRPMTKLATMARWECPRGSQGSQMAQAREPLSGLGLVGWSPGWPIGVGRGDVDTTEVLRTKIREVRRALWIMLGVAVVLPVAVPTSIHVYDAREQRAKAQMVSIAQQVKDPPRMSPLVLHHDCNGDALIRCSWTTDQDVDALALQVKADLAKSADMTTRTECYDVHRRVGGDARSCFVQVGGASHAVTISLDPYVERGSLLGTMYVVQAN